jgi:hypothetical protein
VIVVRRPVGNALDDRASGLIGSARFETMRSQAARDAPALPGAFSFPERK